MADVNNGGSTGTDFQPRTQNPQSNANASLQTTRAGLQAGNSNLLGTNTNIIVATPTGSITVAPTSTVQNTAALNAPDHTAWVAWAGLGIVLALFAIMAIGTLHPNRYK